MPTIREYNQQVGNPSGEIKAYSDPAAAARAGAALTTGGNALMTVGDQIHKMNERRDASLLHAETARARAELSEDLFRSVQDGSVADPEFNKKFGDRVSARLGGIQDKMQTRSGRNSATAYGADLSGQMQVQAYQASAVAAGEQAKLNYQVALNENRKTVDRDPTQFEFVLKETEAALMAANGAYAALPAKERAALLDATRRSMALSAMLGTIRNISPEYAKAQLDAGEGPAAYLDADIINAMHNTADTHIRAREVEDLRLQAKKEKEQADARELIQQDYVDKMLAGTLTTKEIANSELTAAQQEHWINAIRANAERRAQDDPAVMIRLFQDIHRPNGDPKKITSVEQLVPKVGHGIGIPGFDKLVKELGMGSFGQDMEAATQTAQLLFTRSLIGSVLPEVGLNAYYNFRLDFNDAVIKYRAEGKDPRVLITPPTQEKPNPDYWLGAGRISTYLESAQGHVRQAAENIKATEQEARAQMAAGKLPKARTKTDLDKLPPGSWFVNGNTGQLAYKP